MDKKDFERLKEEEKEHLRKVRELKRRLRSTQGTLRAKVALDEIEKATDTSELDAAMEALDNEALDAEVRLDMAMESADENQLESELTPEELRQKKADDLVAQMKAALMPESSRHRSDRTESSSDDDTGEEDGVPEKTIGRSKPEPEAEEEESLPEKTIGRKSSARRTEDPSAQS